jgi:hypothetical protein
VDEMLEKDVVRPLKEDEIPVPGPEERLVKVISMRIPTLVVGLVILVVNALIIDLVKRLTIKGIVQREFSGVRWY